MHSRPFDYSKLDYFMEQQQIGKTPAQFIGLLQPQVCDDCAKNIYPTNKVRKSKRDRDRERESHPNVESTVA